MKLRFEAVAAMFDEDREIAKVVLDAMIVKSQITQTFARVDKRRLKSSEDWTVKKQSVA